MKKLLIVIFIIRCIISFAQSDSVLKEKYNSDFKFNDGIYITYNQFKDNDPIPKSRIATSIDFNDMQFYNKLFEDTETISLYDLIGVQKEIKKKDIWGYCNNGAIFINYNNDFNRVDVIGGICHFISFKVVYDNIAYPYGGYYDYYNRPTTSTEQRQYILLFETGQILDYDISSIELFLMNDPKLHDEFVALKRKKKRQMLFYYLRKFNERNPIYVPIN